MDLEKLIIDLVDRVSSLESKLRDLEKHFTNHLHSHLFDRIVNILYFLAVVGMFCYLKWH